MQGMVVFKLAALYSLTVSILSVAGGVKVQSTASGPVFSAPLKGKVCAFVFEVLQCGCHFAARCIFLFLVVL